jgi:hypothetical protein
MIDPQLADQLAGFVELLAIELTASKHPLRVAVGMILKANTGPFSELLTNQFESVFGDEWENKLREAVHGDE